MEPLPYLQTGDLAKEVEHQYDSSSNQIEDGYCSGQEKQLRNALGIIQDVRNTQEAYLSIDGEQLGGKLQSPQPQEFTNTNSWTAFSDGLLQLRSVQLPSTAQIPSLHVPLDTAVRILRDLGDEAHAWIRVASRILSTLHAKGSVEWATTGGRSGFDLLEFDIKRLGAFVETFSERIKQLNNDHIGKNKIRLLNDACRSIYSEGPRLQQGFILLNQEVELAQEWQEIHNTFLTQITKELGELSSLVFELEECRHQSVLVNLPAAHSSAVIEHHENKHSKRSEQESKVSKLRRFILPPSPVKEAPPTPPPEQSPFQSDASLVKLVARMQPLQASLEFLPMRLSSFQARANELFPAACIELRESQVLLERRWKYLKGDADDLRRELGEDRFILVFRNAGKQAFGMMQAVETSLVRVREVFDNAAKTSHGPGTMKKIESYEAKKLHYCPAIERVLALVDRGAKDRLTVNGEIVRLQAELNQRWHNLQSQMRSVDFTWDCYDEAQQRYRESRSSVSLAEKSVPRLSSPPSPTESPSSSPRSLNFSQPIQPQKNNKPFALLLGGHGLKQPPKPVRTTSKLESGAYFSPFSQHLGIASHERLQQRQVSPAPVPKPRWNYSTVVPEPKPTYSASPLARQDTSTLLRSSSRQHHGAFSRTESPSGQSPNRTRLRNRSSMIFTPAEPAQPATPRSHSGMRNRNSGYFGAPPAYLTPSTPSHSIARNRSSMYFAPPASSIATPPPSQPAIRNRSSMHFGSSSFATPPPTQAGFQKPTSSPLSNSPFPSPPLHSGLDGLLTPPSSLLKPRESLPSLRSRTSSSQLGSSGGSFLPRPTFWRLGTSPEDRGAAERTR